MAFGLVRLERTGLVLPGKGGRKRGDVNVIPRTILYVFSSIGIWDAFVSLFFVTTG